MQNTTNTHSASIIVGTVIAAMLLISPDKAHAQQSRFRLSYRVAAGIIGCPDVGRFTDQVSARIGYVPFTTDAQQTIKVQVFNDGERLVGTCEFTGGTNPPTSRVFHAGAGECAELTDSMALAIALHIDPVAGEAAAGPSPATPTPSEPAGQDASTNDGETRPLVTVHAPPARLKLEAQPAGVTFHLQTGTATSVASGGGVTVTGISQAYERICTAPCEASLPSGAHKLALSLNDGMPVPVAGSTQLDGDSVLSGEYLSRRIIRIIGGITMLAGIAFFVPMFTASFVRGDDGPDAPLLWTGVGVGGTLMIAGSMMALSPDEALIETRPWDRASTP